MSIKKNYIYNAAYQILNLITPLITAPYVARIFGASGVGIQSYTTSISAIFVLIATFGTSTYGQHMIARCRDNRKTKSKTFWEIELLNILIVSLCLVAWLIFILITSEYQNFYIILTMQIVSVAFDVTWLYAAHENFRRITVRNIFVKAVGVILLFACVRSQDDLLLYVGILSASGLIGNISMWFGIKKIISFPKVSDLKFKEHLKQTFIYFIPALATSVYTVMDKTMIGIITNDAAENGYYEQASKIVNLGKTLVLSLNVVVTSRMSYLFAKKDHRKIRELLLKSLDFICLLSLPLTFGIIGISRNFVPWFFGDNFDGAVPILCAQAALIYIIGISNMIGAQYLTPSGQRARSSKGIIAGAAVNFILNVILINLMGALGAVIASIAAEATITTIYVHMSDGNVTWKDVFSKTYKRIIASFIMLCATLLINNLAVSGITLTIIQVFSGIFIYGILLIIMKDSMVVEGIKIISQKFRSKK